jgi:hypothetical protein
VPSGPAQRKDRDLGLGALRAINLTQQLEMGESMKFRLGAVLVAVVAIFSTSGLGAASASAASRPAARFASEATAQQNKAIEGALARVPGGTRISASQARWPAGFGLVVPAGRDQDPLQQCLTTVARVVFCGFNQASWQGQYVYAYNTDADGNLTGDYWVPWGMMEPDQGMYSWYNQTSIRVWREQFKDRGNELCISPWANGNYSDSDYTGKNVNDYWFLLTTVESNC